MKSMKIGIVIVPGDVNVWPHEMETAKTLAFDSRRMKGVPNEAILREVLVCIEKVPEISKLIFISKTGKLIDIK